MRLLVVLCVLIRALASISNAAGPADTAWSRLEELNAKANEPVPVGTNAVEFYAGREKALHDAAIEFVKQFPTDAHRPQAIFWKIETTDFQQPAAQRIDLLRQNELEARPIVEDTMLPQDLRSQVQRTILTQWLDNSDLITTPSLAAEIEERIADLVRNNQATIVRPLSLRPSPPAESYSHASVHNPRATESITVLPRT